MHSPVENEELKIKSSECRQERFCLSGRKIGCRGSQSCFARWRSGTRKSRCFLSTCDLLMARMAMRKLGSNALIAVSRRNFELSFNVAPTTSTHRLASSAKRIALALPVRRSAFSRNSTKRRLASSRSDIFNGRLICLPPRFRRA